MTGQAAHIYSTVEAAKRMAATMYRLGFTANHVGSAVICDAEDYLATIAVSMAPKAEIVAEVA